MSGPGPGRGRATVAAVAPAILYPFTAAAVIGHGPSRSTPSCCRTPPPPAGSGHELPHRLPDLGRGGRLLPAILDSIFRAAGSSPEEELELVPLDPYYRVLFHDGSHIDYVGDPEPMKEQMGRFNAADADRFDDFMARV